MIRNTVLQSRNTEYCDSRKSERRVRCLRRVAVVVTLVLSACVVTDAVSQDFTASFDSDALSRLIAVHPGNGITITYQYDAAGSRTRKDVTSELTAGLGSASPIAGNLNNNAVDAAVIQIALDASIDEDIILSGIEFSTGGTGNEAAAVFEAKLWLDADGDGTVSAGDSQLGSTLAFAEDNGPLPFSGFSQTIPAGQRLNVLLTYTLNGTALPGETFAAAVSDHEKIQATGATSGVLIYVLGTPIDGAVLTAVDAVAPVFSGLTSAVPKLGGVELIWPAATDPSMPITYEAWQSLTSFGGIVSAPPTYTTQDLSFVVEGLTPGQSYFFIVRARDAFGNVDTNVVEQTAVPQSLPTAGFAISQTSNIPPLTVEFTDQSVPGTSPITGRTWQFGDGATANDLNPVHEYATWGLYSASLTVTSEWGSNTATLSVNVEALPQAAFSAVQTSLSTPLTVQFTDTSSAGSSAIVSRLWAFGDGATSSDLNPLHEYASWGDYSVSLSIASVVGANTAAMGVNVEALPVPAFVATPTIGMQPLTVHFTDASSAGSKPISGLLWTFGDGATSTEQNPVHEFISRGMYAAQLAATTEIGTSISAPTSIIVGSELLFTKQPVNQIRYVGETAQFSVETDGGLGDLHHHWKFDNGQKTVVNIGTDSPTLTLSPVTLSNAGEYFCQITDDSPVRFYSNTATLTVGNHLAITGQPEGGDKRVGEAHVFEVETTGGIGDLGYEWKKGDTAISNGTAATYTLSHLTTGDAGRYTVTVSDGNSDVIQSSPAILNVSLGVPVAGLLGVGALCALCAIGGAVVMRKKKIG